MESPAEGEVARHVAAHVPRHRSPPGRPVGGDRAAPARRGRDLARVAARRPRPHAGRGRPHRRLLPHGRPRRAARRGVLVGRPDLGQLVAGAVAGAVAVRAGQHGGPHVPAVAGRPPCAVPAVPVGGPAGLVRPDAQPGAAGRRRADRLRGLPVRRRALVRALAGLGAAAGPARGADPGGGAGAAAADRRAVPARPHHPEPLRPDQTGRSRPGQGAPRAGERFPRPARPGVLERRPAHPRPHPPARRRLARPRRGAGRVDGQRRQAGGGRLALAAPGGAGCGRRPVRDRAARRHGGQTRPVAVVGAAGRRGRGHGGRGGAGREPAGGGSAGGGPARAARLAGLHGRGVRGRLPHALPRPRHAGRGRVDQGELAGGRPAHRPGGCGLRRRGGRAGALGHGLAVDLDRHGARDRGRRGRRPLRRRRREVSVGGAVRGTRGGHGGAQHVHAGHAADRGRMAGHVAALSRPAARRLPGRRHAAGERNADRGVPADQEHHPVPRRRPPAAGGLLRALPAGALADQRVDGQAGRVRLLLPA